jgi:hypothetical protein
MKFEPSEVVGTKLQAAFLRAVLMVLVCDMRRCGLMVLLVETPEKTLSMTGNGRFEGLSCNGFVSFRELEKRFQSDAFRFGIFVIPAFFQPEPAIPVFRNEFLGESGIYQRG